MHLWPEIVTRGEIEYIVHPDDSDEEWEHAFAAISTVEKASTIRKQDPTITKIGDPADLNNYLPDSGATQHMTPHLADLHDTVENKIWVAVA